MTPAVAARAAQLEAERDERTARARFRARHAAERQARISVLLAELVAVLAELPLEADAWPNQHTRKET